MSDANPIAETEADLDPDDTRPEWFVAMLRQGAEADSVPATLAECFEHLMDNVEEWEDGDIDAGDLPGFSEEIQWVIMHSIMFGTLWELAHPSIYAVLDDEGRLIGLYGHQSNADDRAADEPGWYVQRQSVADGDQGYEAVVGGEPDAE